jgi:hypothetical protein
VSIATLLVLKYEALASDASGDGSFTFVRTTNPHFVSHSQPSCIVLFLQQTSAWRYKLPESECKEHILRRYTKTVLKRIFGPKRAKVKEHCKKINS